jgi:hypothetical protein
LTVTVTLPKILKKMKRPGSQLWIRVFLWNHGWRKKRKSDNQQGKRIAPDLFTAHNGRKKLRGSGIGRGYMGDFSGCSPCLVGKSTKGHSYGIRREIQKIKSSTRNEKLVNLIGQPIDYA